MIPIFLMNFLFAISTTIGMAFIPLLVTDNLGMSLLILGLIEGGSELISNVLRLVTGNAFDRIKNRRLLFVVPSILAFISKIILYLPNTLTILTSKVTERISNGSFAAPRDAYIGENAQNKGLALGLLSAAKTVGCVLGPLIVSASTLWLGPLEEHIQIIILLACFVNFTGFILSFFINTKRNLVLKTEGKFDFTKLKEACRELRLLFILSLFFFLGRFNDGVIMLCLKKHGFPEWFYLSTISFFNFVILMISPIMGYLIDKGKEYHILFFTIIGLLGFNLCFFKLEYPAWILAFGGLIFWGIQRAGAQITFSAIIFKKTPIKFYGTAIGIYSFISGVGVFISSLISGYMAQTSFSNAFILSGSFSITAFAMALYMYSIDKKGIT